MSGTEMEITVVKSSPSTAVSDSRTCLCDCEGWVWPRRSFSGVLKRLGPGDVVSSEQKDV